MKAWRWRELREQEKSIHFYFYPKPTTNIAYNHYKNPKTNTTSTKSLERTQPLLFRDLNKQLAHRLATRQIRMSLSKTLSRKGVDCRDKNLAKRKKETANQLSLKNNRVKRTYVDVFVVDKTKQLGGVMVKLFRGRNEICYRGSSDLPVSFDQLQRREFRWRTRGIAESDDRALASQQVEVALPGRFADPVKHSYEMKKAVYLIPVFVRRR